MKNDIGNNREVKKGNLVNYQLRTQRTLCKKIICYYRIWTNWLANRWELKD